MGFNSACKGLIQSCKLLKAIRNVWHHSFFGLCLPSVFGMQLNTRSSGVIGFCPQLKQRVKRLFSWGQEFYSTLLLYIKPNSLDVVCTHFLCDKMGTCCARSMSSLYFENEQWINSEWLQNSKCLNVEGSLHVVATLLAKLHITLKHG